MDEWFRIQVWFDMRRMHLIAITLLLFAIGSADATEPEAPTHGISFQDYADQNAGCVDFTDQCTVCSQQSGKLVCSTAKISCIKTEIKCVITKGLQNRKTKK